jgi:hypothetical protein
MIVGQEDIERANAPTLCWRSTNKGIFSTDVHVCVFFIRSVPDTIFLTLSLPKPTSDRRGPPVAHEPQLEKHWLIILLSLITLYEWMD